MFRNEILLHGSAERTSLSVYHLSEVLSRLLINISDKVLVDLISNSCIRYLDAQQFASQVVEFIKGKSAIHLSRSYLGQRVFCLDGRAGRAGDREYIRHQESEDVRIDQLQFM